MEQVLARLREEHQFILQLLTEPDRILELIEFVEGTHHPLEEEKLFPLIAKAPWLRQGGPQCSLHMGLRLDRDPLERMRTHLGSFYKQVTQQADWHRRPAAAPDWLNAQNPLSIPMEEHALSHDLAAGLKYLLMAPPIELFDSFYKTLHEDFCDLLKLHIDKEDHCLFVMCEERLLKQST